MNQMSKVIQWVLSGLMAVVTGITSFTMQAVVNQGQDLAAATARLGRMEQQQDNLLEKVDLHGQQIAAVQGDIFTSRDGPGGLASDGGLAGGDPQQGRPQQRPHAGSATPTRAHRGGHRKNASGDPPMITRLATALLLAALMSGCSTLDTVSAPPRDIELDVNRDGVFDEVDKAVIISSLQDDPLVSQAEIELISADLDAELGRFLGEVDGKLGVVNDEIDNVLDSVDGVLATVNTVLSEGGIEAIVDQAAVRVGETVQRGEETLDNLLIAGSTLLATIGGLFGYNQTRRRRSVGGRFTALQRAVAAAKEAGLIKDDPNAKLVARRLSGADGVREINLAEAEVGTSAAPPAGDAATS